MDVSAFEKPISKPIQVTRSISWEAYSQLFACDIIPLYQKTRRVVFCSFTPFQIDDYILFFNEQRPAYSLNYLTPKQYRESNFAVASV